MNRREFITLLGGAAATWPMAARGQQAAMPVIGYLSSRSATTDGPMLRAFREGLNSSGHVEGRNVTIDFQWADGRLDRLAALADELVRRRVSIIVTSGGVGAALAAKRASTTIPIVFTSGSDPVRYGLVSSFNRPGGNLTGVSSFINQNTAKQLGLLRDLVPGAAMIGVIANLDEPGAAGQVSEAETAARSVGQELLAMRAGNADEIVAAFETLRQKHAGGLIVIAGPFYLTVAEKLVALAARDGIPTIYPRREYVEAGGLVSYGSNTSEGYRQIGVYAGRILRGEKPADLPVVQSTKFELLINLKTVKTLGLTVPPTLLALADEVIE
jgi:putative ABC transport system substrate-binding protein